MAARPALRALADRVGILPAYVPSGQRRPRSPGDGTREALLAALGLEASSEAAARRALAELAARERARLLEPVRVLVGDGPVRAEVRIPGRGRAPVAYQLALRCADGEERELSGRAAPGRRRVVLPPLPPGIHRLRLALHLPGGAREAEQVLVVAPARCAAPQAALGPRPRAFGLWCNLYSVRSEAGLGVGNLSHLGGLARFAAEAGASFLGINPLHALRNRGTEVSPYAPLSRLFRNPLYLDLEAVPELEHSPEARQLLGSPEAQRRLRALRGASRLDHAAIAAFQRPVLQALHRRFAAGEPEGTRRRAFAAYRARQGPLLGDFATFLAIEEQLAARGQARDWRAWPQELRDPRSPAVEAWRREHAERVELHAFVQFELERQLEVAAAQARRAGLPLGLYQDLALGSAPSGFDAWAFPGLFVEGVSVGAPPDAYAAQGQGWGFPPLHPGRLAADGYAFWVRLLAAGFAHAGALRIDHILGCFRQWWIPAGRPPSDGAYVRFPARDLLAILALESQRHGALVIGEDLGTVPPEVPAALARFGVLSSRVLLFERERDGGFRPAARYSRRALVTANTHDLPPLAGFLGGRDLEIRRRVGELDDAGLARARAERGALREALQRRLVADGQLDAGAADPPAPEWCRAVYSFLCRTPAPLVGVSLDDLAGESEPVNVPGVPPERYPSWTRRMRLPLERLAADPGVVRGLEGTAPRR